MCQKLGRPGRRKYTDNLALAFDFNYNRYIFVMSGLPNFSTHDSVTLNTTLSISHSPRPLTAGPIRYAESMASLLVKVQRFNG